MPFATLALLLAAPPAADWPQFRGPARDGTSPETGLLAAWPDGGPPKRWTVEGVGGGYSSVAAAGGVIYGTGLMPDGQEHVWARDAATGAPKWSTAFAPTEGVGYGDGPRSTPTVADGLVYAVGTGGTLVALDAATGKAAWTKSYVKDFGGSLPGWGYAESVLVTGGRVVGTPGAKSAAMVALDAKTGAEVWRTKLAKPPGAAGGYSSPVAAAFGGVDVVMNLVGNDAGLVIADAKTGAVLAGYAKPLNTVANIPSPVVRGDKIFVSTGYADGGSALLQVGSAGGTLTLTEVKTYRANEVQNHHGGVVPVGGHLYFGNAHNQGHPVCLDSATGEVAWKEGRGALGGDGSAAVIAADGRLVFRYQNGVVALVAADPAGFKPLSAFTPPDPSGKPSWPHPALSGGVLYLRDQDRLHAYDVRAK